MIYTRPLFGRNSFTTFPFFTNCGQKVVPIFKKKNTKKPNKKTNTNEQTKKAKRLCMQMCSTNFYETQ